jgi:hypothetical protein
MIIADLPHGLPETGVDTLGEILCPPQLSANYGVENGRSYGNWKGSFEAELGGGNPPKNPGKWVKNVLCFQQRRAQIKPTKEEFMSKRIYLVLIGGAVVLAVALMVGCGSNGAMSTNSQTAALNGSVVTFGTDAPICDVESFVATITSASLVSSTGQTVSLITSAAPATVDFARLTDFTNVLSTASVAPGTYNQFQMSLTSPVLTAINTSTSPPSPLPIAATLTATSFTININPALVVTSSTTTGLTFDFNLRKSLQVNGSGQVTGTVDPQITITPNTLSGSTVGEADSLYGVVQATSTSNLPTGFTGSFTLTVADGTGQTFTILSNSSTTFEGDGVTSFSELAATDFAEVDAIVNTSGQIIAQTVDIEEQTSPSSQKSAFLGKIISVTRDGSGNATGFTLLVNDEIPSMNGTIPLHSGLSVTLSSSTKYFTNWPHWNREAFVYGPQTVGVAELVSVYGTLGSGTNPTMAANRVFLRPRPVTGNFNTLLKAGSDDATGGFTFTPCGALFGGNTITVLTYADTNFNGVSGLLNLTTSPTYTVRGDMFYQQTSGTATTGAAWTAPTWVMQARGVHQLPN